MTTITGSLIPAVASATIVLGCCIEQIRLARSSLEQTLAREVDAEVGGAVANIRCFGSQPWHFPHSLTAGFTGDYAGGELEVDDEEIIEAP